MLNAAMLIVAASAVVVRAFVPISAREAVICAKEYLTKRIPTTDWSAKPISVAAERDGDVWRVTFHGTVGFRSVDVLKNGKPDGMIIGCGILRRRDQPAADSAAEQAADSSAEDELREMAEFEARTTTNPLSVGTP